MSKHLDGRNDGVNIDISYYTEWDDPIYDEFKDYEDTSDDISHVLKSDAEVKAFEPAKKNLWLKLLIHHKTTTIGGRTKYSFTNGSILQDQRGGGPPLVVTSFQRVITLNRCSVSQQLRRGSHKVSERHLPTALLQI